MKRLFGIVFAICLWFGASFISTPAANADLNFDTLVPCSSSAAFQERLQTEVDGYTARLEKFAPGSAPAQYLQSKIEATKTRFGNYAAQGLLCGEEGLPHLISDGRLDRAGDFVIPGLLFLYIAGWIGWVGRGYLGAIKKGENPADKEIIIDVPLAVQFSLTGFIWPLAALKELQSGELVAPEKEITVSPR